jgi:hypothetical protein
MHTTCENVMPSHPLEHDQGRQNIHQLEEARPKRFGQGEQQKRQAALRANIRDPQGKTAKPN